MDNSENTDITDIISNFYTALDNAPFLLSVKDVMALTGLSRVTIGTMLNGGELPVFYLNGMRRVRKDHFIEWLNKDDKPNNNETSK